MEETNIKTVGRFELRKMLKRRGRVGIYLAHDPHLDRDLTITITDVTECDSDTRARIDERAHVLANLRHAHLSAVLDFGQSDGIAYLATTFVAGLNLREITIQNSATASKHGALIEPRQVALLVGKLALGVSQLHAAGLVHGYLSPESVVVERSGEPVIVDLGMPRQWIAGDDGTSESFRNDFLAPEVSVSAGEEVRPQSDVYSLAAIGFYVLTGHAPSSADEVFDDALFSGLDDHVTNQFKQTFSKALAFGASQRFASARELATAMDGLFRMMPILVRDAGGGSVADPPTVGSSDFAQFDLQSIEDSLVVHLHDASVLSTESLAQTKRELFAMLERFEPKRLIVNFASVRFCSSETVGILIQLYTELKPRSTQLYLCGMRDSIREVFRVLNLDGSVFEIRGTVTNALKSAD